MAVTIGTTYRETSSGNMSVTIPAGANRIGLYTHQLSCDTVPTAAPTVGGVAVAGVTVTSGARSGGGFLVVITGYILEANLPATGAQTAIANLTGGTGITGHHKSWRVDAGAAQSAPTLVTNSGTGATLRLPTASTQAIAAGGAAHAFRVSGPGTTSTAAGNVGTWSETYDEGGSGGGDTTNAGYDVTTAGALSEFLTITQSGATNVVGVMAVVAPVAVGPTIDTQPTAGTAVINNSATPSKTFTVAATTSGGALSYQWQKEDSVGAGTYTNITNGGIHAGATTVSLVVTPTDKTASNGIRYRCVVTDSNGTTTTNAVALTVYNGFQFTGSTTATTNASGQATVTWTDDRPGSLLGNGGYVKHTATVGSAVSRSSGRPT